MSLLLTHPLNDAIALMRGEMNLPDSLSRVRGFPLDSLAVFRLTSLQAAPGHAQLDSDAAWQTIVRSWWGMGITWGLCVTPERDGYAWHLIVPENQPSAIDVVKSHLTGARLEPVGRFTSVSNRMRRMPVRAVMSGHPGTGISARIEHTLRTGEHQEMMILILARAVARDEVSTEVQRLTVEEQFVRDEHLSRQSLERDSHAAATRYLGLLEASRNRAAAAMQEGGWEVRTLVAAASEPAFRRVQGLLHGAFSEGGGKPEPLRWQEIDHPRKTTFLQTAEVAALSRPPQRELPGFIIDTDIGSSAPGSISVSAVFSTATVAPTGDQSVALGRILNDSGHAGAWLEINPDDLCRHLLIAGMPGSGKSVSTEHLLLSLWREHRIPWLVIEPGLKTAYRRLLNSEIASDLTVLAIGNPLSRRVSMNPMAAPPGIGLAEHTGALFAVIASAFELVAPMPEVLATAIEQTYRNHGWDLAGLVPEEPPPRLADLVREIDRSSRELGYGPEITGNIRAGLLLRLRRLLEGPLGPELGGSTGIDMAALTEKPTVIELSCLPTAESQALVMGFITLQLRHHWRKEGISDSLRHLTVIEEAHRLLKSVQETSANASRARAVEDLAHMLAELRGFGAGLAIVDQTPSTLVPSVIANTGTKILHRLDHPVDRDLAGRGAGLSVNQVDILGSLKVGDAILRTDRRPRPYRLRMPNPAVTYGQLPLPELPPAPRQRQATPQTSNCRVCNNAECSARAEAARSGNLRNRLTALHHLLPGGESAIWQWACRELHIQPDPHSSPSAPLCFLIALGEAASLDRVTLDRILHNLSHFIRPNHS
jgi:hypothetical protein